MTKRNAESVSHAGGGGFGPIGGGGFGPIGGGGFGPIGGGGFGPIGGGPGPSAILKRIASLFSELSAAYTELACTPTGGTGFLGHAGGGGFGPIGGGGFGPIGGGPGPSAILKRISKLFLELSEAYTELACTPTSPCLSEEEAKELLGCSCTTPPKTVVTGRPTTTVDFDSQIHFDQQIQKGYEWCWIALAVSVKRHFDKTSTMEQCELAERLLHVDSCCIGSVVRPECDQPGELDRALRFVKHFAPTTADVPNPEDGRALTFEEIQDQINRKVPVCAYIEWPGSPVGHFIAISGYYVTAEGEEYVYVNDPLYGSGPQPYFRVVDNYHFEAGEWKCTYRLKV